VVIVFNYQLSPLGIEAHRYVGRSSVIGILDEFDDSDGFNAKEILIDETDQLCPRPELRRPAALSHIGSHPSGLVAMSQSSHGAMSIT
jgi:hypothetical protein